MCSRTRSGVEATVEAQGVEDAVRLAVVEHVAVVAMDLTLPDGSGPHTTRILAHGRPGLH